MKSKMLYLFLLQTFLSFSQKEMTFSQAEEMLQKNNLILLAEQYSLTAAQAAEIQAKIWEQPYVSAEFNLLNPDANRMFDIGRHGQKRFEIQQLIYLGGKKKNEVALAKKNTEIAKLQLEQLLRNLRLELSNNFFSVFYENKKLKKINFQISQIDSLSINYDAQAEKGNIALKEVVRLKSLVLNLKKERNDLLEELLKLKQNLSLLTGVTENIEPVMDEYQSLANLQNVLISKEMLLEKSLSDNLDYLTAIKNAESQAVNLKLQKSLSVPDITAGISYDQFSGAFNNEMNFSIGIPLPLWNKNKGNIKIAEAEVQQAKLLKEYKKVELESSVESLWQLWNNQVEQVRSIPTTMTQNLDLVLKGMVKNFQKRNIPLIEFIDFMESYNQSNIEIYEIKKSWILTCMNINYITNQDFFKI